MSMNDQPSDEQSLSVVPALLAELGGVLDRLAAADVSQCTDAELVDVARTHEQLVNRMLFEGDRQIVALSDRGVPRAMGYRSLTNFLNVALRVSDPGRRTDQMEATASFRQLSGEVSDPKYPTLAAAFAEGAVGPAHVRKVAEILDKIPHRLPHDRKVAAEKTLAELAREHTPAELTTLGMRLLAHLDPDGELTDAKDRARRPNLWLNRQDAQKMSKLTANLDPQTRALLEMMLAVWAKPGMNNPDDPDSPSGGEDDADIEQVKAAAARDSRSQAQRNHDALNALLTAVFADGLLGKTHRGLPVSLIIKANLADLIRESGLATTATGSVIPIPELIGLAGQIQPYLAIFADATEIPLYFGRGKRLATLAQRLASLARTDGEVCSAPGCDQPATNVEIHHAALDYAEGGTTDIVDLAPACPFHNRRVGHTVGEFTTGVYRDGPHAGRTWWRRNHRPGAPPNPKRLNTRPDIATLYEHNLHQVRETIHGPPADDGPPPARLHFTETIHPPSSVVETRLAAELYRLTSQ